MNERKILKTILLGHLHQLFCDLFAQKIQNDDYFLLESYAMDSKIIQALIRGIVETGLYTLEGIAYHTRIPIEVIYDVASGINNQFSITLWTRVTVLYMQVKPEIATILTDKLLDIKNKNNAAFLFLLNED